jgi:hypothetical protein
MLGFYAYLPDITVWLRMQRNFPFKNYLLELDTQTLQLVLFTCLLFIILAKVINFFSKYSLIKSFIFKVYIAAIIWYCYGYITALTMARTLGTITAHTSIPQSIIGEVNCEVILTNPFNLSIQMYSPPKYEEAIKSNSQQQENNAPPPYTPLLSS